MPFDGTSKPSIGSGASQATIVLNMLEFFFDGGARWARRTYCTVDGKRCLLGALEYVRCETGHRDDRAVQRSISLVRSSLNPMTMLVSLRSVLHLRFRLSAAR
jgi:hypothetical protein